MNNTKVDKSPLVSVVMGVRNGAGHLQKTLASVLQQSDIDFEVIVVNDGSTDNTAVVLDHIAVECPRIRIIHQPTNVGLTKALIVGCESAHGKYIARQDVGDVSLPGRLAKQAELLEKNPALAMVSCWTRTLGPKDEPLYETKRITAPHEATYALQHQFAGPPHHGSVMFRRETYLKCGGYRPQFYFSQDSDLWLRLTEVGSIAYIQETLYEFQICRTGISSQYREVQHALGLISHKCAQARRRDESEDELLLEAQTYCPSFSGSVRSDPVAGDYFIGKCLARNGDTRGIEYLKRVVLSRPARLGAWLGLSSLILRRMLSKGSESNSSTNEAAK